MHTTNRNRRRNDKSYKRKKYSEGAMTDTIVCHRNPIDPNAPEYEKGYKFQNNSRPGQWFSPVNFVVDEQLPRTIRSKRTREDFR